MKIDAFKNISPNSEHFQILKILIDEDGRGRRGKDKRFLLRNDNGRFTATFTNANGTTLHFTTFKIGSTAFLGTTTIASTASGDSNLSG